MEPKAFLEKVPPRSRGGTEETVVTLRVFIA
jgi:hypothetical protein